MAILEAVELLLKQGYMPKRTLYLAFGHDEEVRGKGARAVANLLKSRNITLECVLDEGGSIFYNGISGIKDAIATIGIAEKGYASFEIVANAAGGHSSMPPKKTAVFTLANAILKLEKNTFPAKLIRATEKFFFTLAPKMPFFQRILLANLKIFWPLVQKILLHSPALSAMFRTTLAVTILEAGKSDNVLPQQAKAIVNVRILPGESIEQAKQYLSKVVNDKNICISQPECFLSSEPMEASSISSPSYEKIKQSILAIFSRTIVTPFLVIGTTDSRHYREIALDIYRFSPLCLDQKDLERIHGTNERISTENYQNMIRFYNQVIQNFC
jgi:carboxypeptidase PM20D1